MWVEKRLMRRAYDDIDKVVGKLSREPLLQGIKYK
jgi:hypothetical protein